PVRMLLFDCVATLPSFLHVMLCPRPGPFSGSRSRAVVDREVMYPTRVAGTVTGVSVAVIVFTGGAATLRPRLATLWPAGMGAVTSVGGQSPDRRKADAVTSGPRRGASSRRTGSVTCRCRPCRRGGGESV